MLSGPQARALNHMNRFLIRSFFLHLSAYEPSTLELLNLALSSPSPSPMAEAHFDAFCRVFTRDGDFQIKLIKSFNLCHQLPDFQAIRDKLLPELQRVIATKSSVATLSTAFASVSIAGPAVPPIGGEPEAEYPPMDDADMGL